MGFANEILDAIEIMVRQVVEDNTTKIYPGVCKTTGVNNCVLTINGKDNTVKYYGGVPVVGTVYQVFIPFGNMSEAFIIVPGSGGGSAERKYAAGAINLLPIIPVEYEVTDVRTYATGAINLLHIIPVEYEVIE